MPLINLKTDILCHLCDREVAGHKCLDCSELICQTCKVKHSKAERFRNHKVVVKCKQHNEGISYICSKCVKEVCIKCITVAHSAHDKCVHDYEDGIKWLHSDIENMASDVKQESESLRITLHNDQEMIMEDRKSLQKIQQWHDTQAAKIKEMLAIIEQRDAERETANREYKEILEISDIVMVNADMSKSLKGRKFLMAFPRIKSDLKSTCDRTKEVREKYETYVPVKTDQIKKLGKTTPNTLLDNLNNLLNCVIL